MGNRIRQRRRSRPETRSGRLRATAVAARLGVGLRDARRRIGRTQAQIGEAAGVSQSLISYLERGRGPSASVETWACLAAAVGEQFVGFLERAPGAAQPRDIEHLRRQSALIELVAVGGWSGLPELAIDPGPGWSRSIDVALVRPAAGEAVVVELWDWFDDVGASLRGLDAKVSALGRQLTANPGPGTIGAQAWNRTEVPPTGVARDRLGATWRVVGLFVVRDTRRNRRLVSELRPLFAARFDGSSVGWISALGSPAASMPDRHGFIWSDARMRLLASRLGRLGP